ncbi:MAG: TonB-dependent receptor, partial [Acinetobacter sp.]|nr:TonB-dependent receptor [Acinetobacter sp.]
SRLECRVPLEVGRYMPIFDAGARYKTKLGGVNTTLLFNVDNIANKKYWEGAFMSNYAIVGAERKFKVGVIFDF